MTRKFSEQYAGEVIWLTLSVYSFLEITILCYLIVLSYILSFTFDYFKQEGKSGSYYFIFQKWKYMRHSWCFCFLLIFGFDLPVSEDLWCRALFHVLIGPWFIFSDEMSIQIFCLFFFLMGSLSFYSWVVGILELYIMDMSFSSDMCFANILSQLEFAISR